MLAGALQGGARSGRRDRRLVWTALALGLAACGAGERSAPAATLPEASAATAVPVRAGEGPPRFEDYPAEEAYRGAPAEVDLSSHPAAAGRAELLREAVARGPNFAGRYAIVSWTEPGQLGESFVIVDVASGRVFDGRTDVTPMEFRPDSRLIRFAAPEPRPGRARCAGCTESYEVWDGRQLRLIPPELWAPSAPPPAHARELVERVRAEEAPSVLATFAPEVVRPAWDRLVITAENGTRTVLTDEVVEGDLRSIHRFVGSPEPLPVFVVERRYVPEGRAMLMVDRRTGQVTELDDEPVPSVDGQRFATASLDLVAGHLPNRIRVYRMEAHGPVLEWELEPREWGARNPTWIDARTLQLERATVDWRTHELFTAPLRLRRGAQGWSPEPSPDHARQSLQSFLSALGQGFYMEAAQHFGGSYQQLREWNPDLDPQDLPALWRAACEGNGLRCLGRAEVLRTEQRSPDEVRFTVRLLDDAGKPLVLGPCCGETEATMPTRREFQFTVRREGHGYRVMDLPPYQP